MADDPRTRIYVPETSDELEAVLARVPEGAPKRVPWSGRALSVKFRKPTPIVVELVSEARREKLDGRRTKMFATLSADGVVTAEAEGLFVALTAEHVDRYFDDPEEFRFTRRSGG